MSAVAYFEPLFHLTHTEWNSQHFSVDQNDVMVQSVNCNMTSFTWQQAGGPVREVVITASLSKLMPHSVLMEAVDAYISFCLFFHPRWLLVGSFTTSPEEVLDENPKFA